MFGSFGALRLMPAEAMVIGPFEDWSDVRSPSRAKRRRARGHRQRVRLFHKPDPNVIHDARHKVIYGHPTTLAKLTAMVDEKARRP